MDSSIFEKGEQSIVRKITATLCYGHTDIPASLAYNVEVVLVDHAF